MDSFTTNMTNCFVEEPGRNTYTQLVSFYLADRASIDDISAHMHLQWMAPSSTLTAPLESCAEFGLQVNISGYIPYASPTCTY